MQYLAYLACPVGMGLMMWMMMRGNNTPTSPPDQERLAALQREVDDLRRKQERDGSSVGRIGQP